LGSLRRSRENPFRAREVGADTRQPTEKEGLVDNDRVKGKGKQIEGKTQEKWGEAKDKARDTWDDAKDKTDDWRDDAEEKADDMRDDRERDREAERASRPA
jgi:uncharacterized protein YjbJ (UPF0337 family)